MITTSPSICKNFGFNKSLTMKQYNVMEFAGIVDRITANGKGICEKDGQPKKGRKLIK